MKAVVRKVALIGTEYKAVAKTIQIDDRTEFELAKAIYSADDVKSLRKSSISVIHNEHEITYKHDEGVEYTRSANDNEFAKVLNDMLGFYTKRIATKYLLRILKKDKKLLELKHLDKKNNMSIIFAKDYAELIVSVEELEEYLA